MLIPRNLQLLQKVLQSTLACVLSLLIVVQIWLQILLLDSKAQQILLEVLKEKSLPSFFLLVLLDK